MDSLGWAVGDVYRFEGTEFVVRATDERFLELVRPHLAPYRIDEATSQDAYCFSADCGVSKRLAGGTVARGVSTLYLETLAIFRGRDDEEMAGRLFASIREAAMTVQNEFIRIRAGGVTVDGGALLLPAAPEPHLPALVGELVRRGARYLGDEMIKIDPVLRLAHPIALPLLIDSDDLHLFRRHPTRNKRRRRPDGPDAMTPRYPVAVTDVGGTVADASPIRRIVFPTFEQGAQTRLEPLPASRALFAFSEAGLNLHIWGDRALTLMRELLDDTGAALLVVGSIGGAADLLLGHAADAGDADV